MPAAPAHGQPFDLSQRPIGGIALKRIILCGICLSVLTFVFSFSAHGALIQGSSGNTVTLAWDANTEPDLAGYKVYWGRSSRHYDNSPVPTVAPSANPTFTTPALPNGTWYFAVTAYNTSGLESDYSNEVSKTIATAPAAPKGLRIWIVEAIAWILHHIRFWA
jgi:hypothetical protein